MGGTGHLAPYEEGRFGGRQGRTGGVMHSAGAVR